MGQFAPFLILILAWGLNSETMRSQGAVPATSQTAPIKLEKTKLEQLKQVLLTLRNQQSEQERQTILTYSQPITDNDNQIQTLTDLLDQHRLAENDVNEAATLRLQEQSSAEKSARDQIDQNIISLEQELRQTQNLIAYWQMQFSELDTKEDQLASLYPVLQNQESQLAQLRQQRVDISTQVLLGTQAISSATEGARAQLAANEKAIQNEITNLKESTARLLRDQDQARASSEYLAQQVRQAEFNYNQQRQKVKKLESP